jgi:3-oxo-5-alpha-steroid 4-dehydrogenase 1
MTNTTTNNNFLSPAGPYSPPYTWEWNAHNIILLIILSLSISLILWTILAHLFPTHISMPDAAYGKFSRTTQYSTKTWMEIDGTLAWWIMESPSVWLAFLFFFVIGPNGGSSPPPYRFEPAPIVMFVIYELHYIHRDCIYPFLLINEGKSVSVFIILASLIYNSFNTYLIISFISSYGQYPATWLYDPRFIIGLALYIVGYIINRQSDDILQRLRRRDDSSNTYRDRDQLQQDETTSFIHPVSHKKYFIPKGGMFEYVSCANYFGEATIWFGYAMLTWSLEGLSFFLLTMGNLAPRAARYHEFYQTNFPNYPSKRKALIPFVW